MLNHFQVITFVMYITKLFIDTHTRQQQQFYIEQKVKHTSNIRKKNKINGSHIQNEYERSHISCIRPLTTYSYGWQKSIFVGSLKRQLIFCLRFKSFWCKQVRQKLCMTRLRSVSASQYVLNRKKERWRKRCVFVSCKWVNSPTKLTTVNVMILSVSNCTMQCLHFFLCNSRKCSMPF